MASMVPEPASKRLLRVVHYAYPIILLAFFLAAFTIRSILVARKKTIASPEQPSDQTGPGGKPLPKKVRRNEDKSLAVALDFSKSRKMLFIWLSVATAATFIAQAANVIVHALVDREEGWWCGKATVVRLPPLALLKEHIANREYSASSSAHSSSIPSYSYP